MHRHDVVTRRGQEAGVASQLRFKVQGAALQLPAEAQVGGWQREPTSAAPLAACAGKARTFHVSLVPQCRVPVCRGFISRVRCLSEEVDLQH